MNKAKVIEHISQWLALYSKKSATNGFVIGVSGGIDSAVASTLGAATGLSIVCVEMPIYQPVAHASRSKKHIEWLGSKYSNVKSVEIDLTGVFDAMSQILPDKKNDELALANTRARLRMTALYHIAAQQGALVLGTGNKVEDFGIGFYTKYGDGGVDISPIADLNKSEVYALGSELGIIEDIMSAAPSDGLWIDDRTDEDQIGATYPELEWAMTFNGNQEELTSRQRKVLKIYQNLNGANQHKMVPIPVCKIPRNIRG